jgi:glycine/D-amino acid oxidase-like deaminating enzyme
MARGRGVEVLRAEVTDVLTDAAGVRAVQVLDRTGRRTLETRCLVDAAGPFLAEVARTVGLELPVATVLHQLVVMPDPHAVVPRSAPYTILMEPQALRWSDQERTWLREDGLERLMEPLPGALHLRPDGPLDSTWIRLGWPYHREAERPRWAPGFPPEFADVVVRGSERLCPGMARYVEAMPSRVSVLGGYYCKTPENLPLIGPTDVVGFYLMGALSGYGLMAACAAADSLAGWIDGDPLPGSEYFSMARYRDPDFLSSQEGPAAAGEL